MQKSVLTFIIIFAANILFAQNLTMPEVSQQASVTQRIGLTDITISYHSPLVGGRQVWGKLVPYNEPWRAGANENTVISFSSDVKVEGKLLAEGTYGLHMIPTEKEWTIIFSKNSTSWGSFFYDKNEDALRINVTPFVAENQDWLSFSFADIKRNSTVIQLRWEKLLIPIKIDIDVPAVVLESIKKELRGTMGFTWQGFQQAAAYCLRNDLALDDAAKWIERSISIQKNFSNLRVKSQLLAKQGKQAEADALMKEAMAMADETQLNAYGYDLLAQKKNNEALEIFKMNVKRYPDSWNVYDSLGETQDTMGDKKNAMANYKLALAKAPADQHSRIKGIISQLEGK